MPLMNRKAQKDGKGIQQKKKTQEKGLISTKIESRTGETQQAEKFTMKPSGLQESGNELG